MDEDIQGTDEQAPLPHIVIMFLPDGNITIDESGVTLTDVIGAAELLKFHALRKVGQGLDETNKPSRLMMPDHRGRN